MSKIWDISCILQCPTQDCSEALIVNNYIKAFHSSRCDVGVLIVKHVHREKSKCQYPTLINFLVAARLDKNPKAMSIYHMSNTTVTERHDPSLLALRNMFIYPLSICQVNIQLFCIKSSLQWSDRKTLILQKAEVSMSQKSHLGKPIWNWFKHGNKQKPCSLADLIF